VKFQSRKNKDISKYRAPFNSGLASLERPIKQDPAGLLQAVRLYLSGQGLFSSIVLVFM
jgi:hypothetical protein